MRIRPWMMAAALIPFPVAARGDYTPTDLLVTYGVSPVAFNANGQFAGTEGGLADSVAYRWTVAGGTEPLGTLGGAASAATAIGGSGAVVGSSQVNPGSTIQRAFLWTPAAGMTDLGTLGGASSFATAVNGRDWVAGASQTNTGDQRAFIHRDGIGPIDLGTLGGATSRAAGINDAGVVVGSSSTRAGGQTRAFAWMDGSLMDLGSLGGAAANSRANGVNNAGVVVGQSDAAGGSVAFRWTQAGGMQSLGGLGGVSAAALAVNDSGLVVGTGLTAGGERRGWVWDAANGVRDLNALIPAGQDYVITEAFAVNADGQILAYAEVNDLPRVILLDPTGGGGTDPNPIPTPASLPLAAAAGLLLVVRRRMKLGR